MREMTERVRGRDVSGRGLVIAHEVLNHDDKLVEEILVEQDALSDTLITTFVDSERQLQATLARQLSSRLTSGQGNVGTPNGTRNGLRRKLLAGTFTEGRLSGPGLSA